MILGVLVVIAAIIWLVTTSDSDGMASSSSLSAVQGLPGPSPSLSPSQVVQTVMESMHRNNDPSPDAGIKTAFNFASPANKRQTGPVDRFVQMVRDPMYKPMLDSQAIEYGPLTIEGDAAQQLVTVVDADSRVASYVFSLSRQGNGRYAGCWMTDGVVRVEPMPEAMGEPGPMRGPATTRGSRP
jgi:hypothetical protein